MISANVRTEKRTEVIDRCCRCLAVKLIDHVISNEQSTRYYCKPCAIALNLHAKKEAAKVGTIQDRLEEAIAFLQSKEQIFSVSNLCTHAGTYLEYLHLHPALLQRAKQAAKDSRVIALKAAIRRLKANGDRPSMRQIAKALGMHHSSQLKRIPELREIALEASNGWVPKYKSQHSATLNTALQIIADGGILTHAEIAARCNISVTAMQRHDFTLNAIAEELNKRLESAIAHFTANPPSKPMRSAQLADHCKTNQRTMRVRLGSDRVDQALATINALVPPVPIKELPPSKGNQITQRLAEVMDKLVAEKGVFTQTEFIKAYGPNAMTLLKSRPELKARLDAITEQAKLIYPSGYTRRRRSTSQHSKAS